MMSHAWEKANQTPAAGPPATTYFMESDNLGTERVRTNLTPLACETISSLPFGDGLSVTGSCGDPSPLHFTGQEHDSESALDNFEARYYGSGMGRFMSPDPDNAGASLGNPQSFNAYAYVMNNPLAYVDPSGLCGDLITDPPGFQDCMNDFPGSHPDGNGWPSSWPTNPMLTGNCPAEYETCHWSPNGSVIAVKGPSEAYAFYWTRVEDSKTGWAYAWAPVLLLSRMPYGRGGPDGNTTISAGDPNAKKNYCSHKSDQAALEDLLPGITRGDFVATAAHVGPEAGAHLALEGAAASGVLHQAIRAATGIPKTITAEVLEWGGPALLVISGVLATRAAQQEYKACMAE